MFEELKAKDDQVRGRKARARTIAGKGGRTSQADSRPLSPSTLRAEQAYESSKARGKRKGGAGEQGHEDEPKGRRRKTRLAPVPKAPRGTVDDRSLRRDRFDETEESRAVLPGLDDSYKPHKVTALPPINRRLKTMKPLPGVSYLATSGLYDDLVGNRKAF